MRLSNDENDVGYIAYLAVKDEYKETIVFNGVTVWDIITADTDTGYLRYIPSKNGKRMTNAQGDYQEAEVYGKVEILLEGRKECLQNPPKDLLLH